MIDRADNWLQLRRLSLTVWTTNKAAIALYEKFGFNIEGTMPKYAFGEGKFVDALLMGRLKRPSLPVQPCPTTALRQRMTNPVNWPDSPRER